MDLPQAVSATVAYASYFKFPLFPEELHHWLIYPKVVSFKKITPYLPKKMSVTDRQLRSTLTQYSREKILHTQKLISFLRFVPGLKFVALTGSVASGNSKKDDDIDLFFVTTPHTLWLVRPLVITLITLFFRRRYPQEDHSHAPNAYCPNLWLDSLSLRIPPSKWSLFTAHEVLQIVPLLDRGDTYQNFLIANHWTKKFLANAYQSSLQSKRGQSPMLSSSRKRGSIPFSILLFPLNYFSYLIQLLYMLPKKTTETVHLHAAFLHTTDFSSKLEFHLNSQLNTPCHSREGGNPSGK